MEHLKNNTAFQILWEVILNSSARAILRVLANGFDPMTGDRLPASAPYNHPEIIRALFGALEELEGQKPLPKPTPRNQPERHGMSWSENERHQTIADFKSGMPINIIATKLKRTKGSVWAILENHGLVKPLYHTANPTPTQSLPQPRPNA